MNMISMTVNRDRGFVAVTVDGSTVAQFRFGGGKRTESEAVTLAGVTMLACRDAINIAMGSEDSSELDPRAIAEIHPRKNAAG